MNGGAIGVTVLASAGFGFLNEWRSEKAIAALAHLTARRVEVLRDGQHTEIRAREVVPGDVHVVDDGDVIAAVGRVIESRGLRVNESILTGELGAVTKSPEPSGDEVAAASTMVFVGTTVASGSGSGTVLRERHVVAAATRPGLPRTRTQHRRSSPARSRGRGC